MKKILTVEKMIHRNRQTINRNRREGISPLASINCGYPKCAGKHLIYPGGECAWIGEHLPDCLKWGELWLDDYLSGKWIYEQKDILKELYADPSWGLNFNPRKF